MTGIKDWWSQHCISIKRELGLSWSRWQKKIRYEFHQHQHITIYCLLQWICKDSIVTLEIDPEDKDTLIMTCLVEDVTGCLLDSVAAGLEARSG